MSYDLIASFVQQKMNIDNLFLHHFSDLKELLIAAENNKFDIIIINSPCLFDGTLCEKEIRKVLTALCKNNHITTVFFADNMKAQLLKKLLDAGVNVMISSKDKPHELLTALKTFMISTEKEAYISQSIREHLEQECDDLTPKEWEVINLIQEGYSLSEIAIKKCRAMSTVSTQKRKAMKKLRLRNESELLRFLHQNALF